jgi:hypothetical protein
MRYNQYEILVAGSAAALEKCVMERIGKGWQPIGGVSVAVYVDHGTGSDGDYYDNGGTTYAQAVGTLLHE